MELILQSEIVTLLHSRNAFTPPNSEFLIWISFVIPKCCTTSFCHFDLIDCSFCGMPKGYLNKKLQFSTSILYVSFKADSPSAIPSNVQFIILASFIP